MMYTPSVRQWEKPTTSIVQMHITRATDDSKTAIHFQLNNVSQIHGSIRSPPTYVRSLPWQLMITPVHIGDVLTYYGFILQCNVENEYGSYSWSCNAEATLRIHSYVDDVEPIVRQIKYQFSKKKMLCVFDGPFVDFAELHDAEKCFVKEDRIDFELEMVVEEPEGIGKDSKSCTGYVGMVNQGATCYLNSMLQTLFCTNQLRKAVYKMPTGTDDSAQSVGLNLQQVFFELQFLDQPVDTKTLCKGFGWYEQGAPAQRDVQEFLRLLLGTLEHSMECTAVAGTASRLFEGRMSSYYMGKNINHQITRQESFYNIQLKVKGKKNVVKSLLENIVPEKLKGTNMFPPVLHLQLMRNEVDAISATSIKCNDHFEFYEKMELDQFLLGADVPSKYTLQAVLVHCGKIDAGHYAVYIDPLCNGRWHKFDDEVVSRCSKFEAIEQNYGGNSMHSTYGYNACMLVYVRDADMATVLQQVDETDLPTELCNRLEEKRRRIESTVERIESTVERKGLTFRLKSRIQCFETNSDSESD